MSRRTRNKPKKDTGIIDGIAEVGGEIVEGVADVGGAVIGGIGDVAGAGLEAMGGCLDVGEGCAGCASVIIIGGVVTGLLGWAAIAGIA